MPASKKVQWIVRPDAELVGLVEAARGAESRQSFICRVLREACGSAVPSPTPTAAGSSSASKEQRLAVARRVVSSAEAKAGVRPIEWRR